MSASARFPHTRTVSRVLFPDLQQGNATTAVYTAAAAATTGRGGTQTTAAQGACTARQSLVAQ